MAEPPKRKRLQVHLSTALVLMFATGVLLWANLTERDWATYGWPCAAVRQYLLATPDISLFNLYTTSHVGEASSIDGSLGGRGHLEYVREVDSKLTSVPFEPDEIFFPNAIQLFGKDLRYNVSGLAINFGVALLILVSIAVACETWIRKRQRK